MGEVRHVAVPAILRFFEYDHLPNRLAAFSKPFHDLAHELADNDSLDGPELTVALRKLLEAKDAAVRAALPANRCTPPTHHHGSGDRCDCGQRPNATSA